MDKDTRPKGWHDDFASDRPEHARRQSLRPQVEQAKQAIAELPESVRANAHMEGCHHEGFASPTGPDTRQADMVSREKVIELLEGIKETAEPTSRRIFINTLIAKVKSL